MVAFWGCEVTETKAAVVDVPEGFVLNVCNATSGVSSADAQVALGLETQQLDGKAWKGAVAHLGGKQPLQVKLDLVFGHKVKFYLAKGSGAVNLTGYFQPGPPADLFEADETPKIETAIKKSKKRAREEKKEEKKPQKSSDEVSEVPEKKVKTDKPATSTPPAKEEQKKSKPADTPAKAPTSNNDAATSGSSQKKKRKKNKNKKHAATNGGAK